jgi:hypothetical protein
MDIIEHGKRLFLLKHILNNSFRFCPETCSETLDRILHLWDEGYLEPLFLKNIVIEMRISQKGMNLLQRELDMTCERI